MTSISFAAHVVSKLVLAGANRSPVDVLEGQQIYPKHPGLQPERLRQLQVRHRFSINHRRGRGLRLGAVFKFVLASGEKVGN